MDFMNGLVLLQQELTRKARPLRPQLQRPAASRSPWRWLARGKAG